MNLLCGIALAASSENVDSLLLKINKLILNPIIGLMFAVATVVFLYGVVEYIANANNDEKRNIGKRHIVWGVVGLFLMFSVYGVINLLLNFWNNF